MTIDFEQQCECIQCCPNGHCECIDCNEPCDCEEEA